MASEEIETNYLAPLRVTRAFAPTLIANRGAVLNMLTILSRVNLPFMGSYCASKAAALSLTQGMRGELAPQGVRVAAALPGAVDTRMTAVLTDSENDAGRSGGGDPRWIRGGRGRNLCRRDGARHRPGSRP